MSRHLVDPELSAGLDMSLPYDLSAETLPLFRSMVLDMVAAMSKTTTDATRDVRFEDRLIPGPAGAPNVRVLIYTPGDRSEQKLPAILQIHGGGFVTGNADMGDLNNRASAIDFNCVIVAVDYRLAPETPYPGPVEDCYAALLWLQSAGDELGIDPDRIVVEGGSAGAGLAASLCLLARDRGQVQPCFQYLSEPMLDYRSVESDHPHVGHFVWTRELNRFGWSSMLDGRADGGVSPYASPAIADDLSGLPPTFIQVGAIDLFLEESLDYARRLTRAGVSVELHVWPGAYHTFLGKGADVSREARRIGARAIRSALRKTANG